MERIIPKAVVENASSVNIIQTHLQGISEHMNNFISKFIEMDFPLSSKGNAGLFSNKVKILIYFIIDKYLELFLYNNISTF